MRRHQTTSRSPHCGAIYCDDAPGGREERGGQPPHVPGVIHRVGSRVKKWGDSAINPTSLPKKPLRPTKKERLPKLPTGKGSSRYHIVDYVCVSACCVEVATIYEAVTPMGPRSFHLAGVRLGVIVMYVSSSSFEGWPNKTNTVTLCV
jgi:hypothetical protein